MPTAIPSFGPGEAQPLSIVTQSGSEASSSTHDLGPLVESGQSAEANPVASFPIETKAANACDATTSPVQASFPLAAEPLQRIADVRVQQGLSLRTIARRTGLETKELRRHEDPRCDLPLSLLRKWQEALEVPVADLLEDEQSLSRPVKERAKMVRIMKTAVSLRDACEHNIRLARLAGMLCDQLLDLMPELKEVGSWPQTGSRRGPDVMGRIFHEPISVETPDHE